MKNFSYNVNIYFADGDENTLRTNSIKSALDAFFASVEDGHHTDIVNGFTGEVLAIANTDEPWVTDEMGLMMVGHLAAQAWDEPSTEAEEDEPVCQMCGGDINENGVCRWCGVVYGAEPSHEMTTAEDMVQGLIKALGGLPS
jgi:hypothetical protein